MLQRILSVFVVAATAICGLLATPGQAPAQAAPASEIVLVLPFENLSDHSEYNWIGESFADSLSALLNKPGLIVVTSEERAVAYQRLRLPLTVLPSRATAIKIARELKASMIVIGTYNVVLAPPASDDKSKTASDKPIASISG